MHPRNPYKPEPKNLGDSICYVFLALCLVYLAAHVINWAIRGFPV